MERIFESLLALVLCSLGLKFYLKKKRKGFRTFYGGVQENTIKESNLILNNLLLKYSENPSDALATEIYDLLSQNTCYVILTFKENNDPNDNRTLKLKNSINFRKVKEGNIGVFTDFELMKSYVGDYISTEILLIGDFIKLCNEEKITSFTLNFTLKNPFTLSQ